MKMSEGITEKSERKSRKNRSPSDSRCVFECIIFIVGVVVKCILLESAGDLRYDVGFHG